VAPGRISVETERRRGDRPAYQHGLVDLGSERQPLEDPDDGEPPAAYPDPGGPVEPVDAQVLRRAEAEHGRGISSARRIEKGPVQDGPVERADKGCLSGTHADAPGLEARHQVRAKNRLA